MSQNQVTFINPTSVIEFLTDVAAGKQWHVRCGSPGAWGRFEYPGNNSFESALSHLSAGHVVRIAPPATFRPWTRDEVFNIVDRIWVRETGKDVLVKFKKEHLFEGDPNSDDVNIPQLGAATFAKFLEKCEYTYDLKKFFPCGYKIEVSDEQ
jgi:hypothetical protein